MEYPNLHDTPEEQPGLAARFLQYHWEEFKGFGPKDYLAGYSVITGGIALIRNNHDPVVVAKGVGKVIFGVVLGSTGKGR